VPTVSLSRLLWALVVLTLAVSSGALVLISGDSTALLLVGVSLLLAGAVGGMFLGLSALWRLGKEPTTLAREDGRPLLSKEQSRALWREVALYSLAGALLTPLVVVASVDDPQIPLAVKIIGGIVLGAALAPILRFLPLW
jgi:hypothetical protein